MKSNVSLPSEYNAKPIEPYISSIIDYSDLHINECGFHRVTYNTHAIFRPLGCNDYQIIYVNKGIAHFYLKGEDIPVSEGGLILYSPNEEQNYRYFPEDNCEVYWIHFEGKKSESILSECNFTNRNLFHVTPSEEYTELFNNIIFETNLKKRQFYNISILNFLNLLCLFARNNIYFSNNFDNVNYAYVKNSQIWPAIKKIQQDYMLNESIAVYAEMCHLSYYRFIHLFTDLIGLSPTEYRQNIRIDHAKRLLANSSSSILEIALSSGFENQKYFSQYFKRKTGFTPSQYRQFINK